MKKARLVSTVSKRSASPAATPLSWGVALHAFNPRQPSLGRGIVMVVASLLWAFRIAGFPEDHASSKLIFPTLLAGLGTWESIRCLQRRWSLYHSAVMIVIYMDIMALSMILFLFLYPYGRWLL